VSSIHLLSQNTFIHRKMQTAINTQEVVNNNTNTNNNNNDDNNNNKFTITEP